MYKSIFTEKRSERFRLLICLDETFFFQHFFEFFVSMWRFWVYFFWILFLLLQDRTLAWIILNSWINLICQQIQDIGSTQTFWNDPISIHDKNNKKFWKRKKTYFTFYSFRHRIFQSISTADRSDKKYFYWIAHGSLINRIEIRWNNKIFKKSKKQTSTLLTSKNKKSSETDLKSAFYSVFLQKFFSQKNK